MLTPSEPVPCNHIYDYYEKRWQEHKCIAYNLLRRGYWQHAKGMIELGVNNLYESEQS